MEYAKRLVFIIGLIFLCIIIIFGLTFIPHKLIKTEPSLVKEVVIFDGGTGEETIIKDRKHIDQLITNLNQITFQKEKLSIFYMGFSFNITLYDDKHREIKQFIINSKDKVRYKGFFYKAVDSEIDYDYIKQLVNGTNSMHEKS